MKVMVTHVEIYEVDVPDDVWQSHADAWADMGDQLDMTIEVEVAAGRARTLHRHFAVTAQADG